VVAAPAIFTVVPVFAVTDVLDAVDPVAVTTVVLFTAVVVEDAVDEVLVLNTFESTSAADEVVEKLSLRASVTV
jgi:hypothetical protein